mmetsp:Transcript_890/g.1588  ORF Transcript_890/g.1588 Transcript_890/m.1588 type:complete len:240 (-) Transcript_890:79-798(-)
MSLRLFSSPLTRIAVRARPQVLSAACLAPEYRFMSTTSEGHVGLKPTIAMAKECPREFYEMGNDMIIRLAAEGVFEAIQERLVRDIMAVDEIEYDEAREVMAGISSKNQEGMFVQTLPYYAGISTGLVGAFGSIPLCFERNTVAWFNDRFVTTEVPPPEDLETWLEVGSWAWNWMEPPLGQISFFLLALQFARAQMENLGIKPYTAMMKSRRAERLANAFPKYSPQLIKEFSKAQSLVN